MLYRPIFLDRLRWPRGAVRAVPLAELSAGGLRRLPDREVLRAWRVAGEYRSRPCLERAAAEMRRRVRAAYRFKVGAARAAARLVALERFGDLPWMTADQAFDYCAPAKPVVPLDELVVSGGLDRAMRKRFGLTPRPGGVA